MNSRERRIILCHSHPEGAESQTLITDLAYNLSELSRRVLVVTDLLTDPTLSQTGSGNGVYKSLYGHHLLPLELYRELSIHDRPALARILATGYDFIFIHEREDSTDDFTLRLAGEVIVLMQPELNALESGYIQIKQLGQDLPELPVYLLFHETDGLNRRYYFTLQDMTRRFLQRRYPVLGEIQEEHVRRSAGQQGIPLSYLYPGRNYSKDLRRAARFLLHIDVRLASQPDLRVFQRTNWIVDHVDTENH